MNEVSSVKIFLRELESPPQIINLKKVAMCERLG